MDAKFEHSHICLGFMFDGVVVRAGLSFGVSGFSVFLSARHASVTISDAAFCQTRVQELFGSRS
jgi:hypothetical protein